MPKETTRQHLFDRPGRYQIRVLGALDPCWVDYLEGLEISTAPWAEHPQVTQLNGWLANQTALAGLLDLLNDLGKVILTVERIEPDLEIE